MERYLRSFANHTSYEAFTGTSEFVKPNVSLCQQEMEVHYNPEKAIIDSITINDVQGDCYYKGMSDGWYRGAYNSETYTITIIGSGFKGYEVDFNGTSNMCNSFKTTLASNSTINSITQSSTEIVINVTMNQKGESCAMGDGFYLAVRVIGLGDNGSTTINISHLARGAV